MLRLPSSVLLSRIATRCTSQTRLQSSSPIVLVDGTRTPFLASLTQFQHMMPHHLLAQTFSALLGRSGLPVEELDYLCAGTVQQDVSTSNIAKEAGFEAGFPKNIPGHTVTMACISSNQAVASCMGLIGTGTHDVCMAGGVEFCSDQPIRYPRVVRQLLMKGPRARTADAKMEVGDLARSFNPAALSPEIPDPREFTTKEVMGHFTDRVCEEFGVSRLEQDDFARRSHQMAFNAAKDGLLSDIIPVKVPGLDDPITADNGIRVASPEQVAKLKPAFRKGGTVTAANSSFLSDGASACLITTEQKAKDLGLKPKAYLREVSFVSADPKEELLLGPAYATPNVLNKAGLGIDDIDVFEFHEAFAGQVLANLKAIDSDKFCGERMGRSSKLGEIPMEKLNLWGGSVSLGHPFGATGIRLLMHAANRLIHEDGQKALVAACAGNAQGVGMILERYPDA